MELSHHEQTRPGRGSPILLLSFILALAPLLGAPVIALDQDPKAEQTESTSGQVSMDLLLERMARVAELYNDNALRFSCDEEITYTLFGASGRVRDRRKYNLQYMYIYELDPETAADVSSAGEAEGATEPGEAMGTGAESRGRLADYRTIRNDDGGEDSYREVELEELALPNYLKQAYSWAFIFEEARQARYSFEILGEENVHGRDAIVLAFDPIPPYVHRVNDWFGKAWIDKESSQILRVEARSSDSPTEEASEGEQISEEPAEEGMTFSVTSVITEFSIEKNGMRFPSHAMLSASVSRRFGEGAHVVAALTGDVGEYETEVRTVFRVDQTYNDYRFFNVRSETEIRDFVLGIRQS